MAEHTNVGHTTRWQRFDVAMQNCPTGERWEVTVWASDPADALAKVLRRRRFAEALLSEQAHRFEVRDLLVPSGHKNEAEGNANAA